MISVKIVTPALCAAALAIAGCAGKHFRLIEDQNKKILRDLDELKTTIGGMDKRLAVRQTMAAMASPNDPASSGAGRVAVATLLADPLSYSGQPVQVEAVLAAPVDKERAFFVVTGKPKDIMNNVGVYFDPEDMSTKLEVYLADPGQWLLIEGQLSVDKAPNAYKTYSGYALKAKSVKKISK